MGDVVAIISCHKLTDPTAYGGAAFGQTTLPIIMDDVMCSGSESTLTFCSYDPHTADCSHSEDAGVKCQYGMSANYFLR